MGIAEVHGDNSSEMYPTGVDNLQPHQIFGPEFAGFERAALIRIDRERPAPESLSFGAVGDLRERDDPAVVALAGTGHGQGITSIGEQFRALGETIVGTV